MINEKTNNEAITTEETQRVSTHGFSEAGGHLREVIICDDAVDLVKAKVDRVLSSAPFIIRDYTKHLMAAKGKFIRAAALIACAENKEGFVHPNAIRLAAALEVLHLATLVHDDVIDNSNKRRGIITLQKKYGKRTAVICGDYLFCMALKLAASVSDRQDYLNLNIPDYMSKICLGELNQHINNGNLDLSVLKYFKIISGKTAALFEASFYAGAILCESSEADVSRYMRLGRYIGMIFQLNDDCMDFEATENVAKKPVQSDYEQGVITLPLIFAFKKLSGFKEKVKENAISKSEIIAAVLKADGLGLTKKISEKYYKKCMRIMDELEITEAKRQKLISVLDKAFKGLQN